jgi:hypothetical protein
MWPWSAGDPNPFRSHRFMPLRLLARLALSGFVAAGSPPDPVEITALRQEAVPGRTRVVIEFSDDFEFHSNRLHSPERVYFDFSNTRLGTGIRSAYSQESANEKITRIRIAETAPGVTRVVLDLLEQADFSAEKLRDPFRLVVELRPMPSATPQLRTRISPPDDHAPLQPNSNQETAALKPSIALVSRMEPDSQQALPVLNRRHAMTLSQVKAAPGSVAIVRLDLDSPAGEEPQALQWELSYPSPKLGIEEGDLAAGGAAASAEKSLVCAGRVESAAQYVYRCILAGGLKVIPNGTIATIQFHVRQHAEAGSATVRVSNAVAVTKDLKEHELQPCQADVTIQ